MSMVKAPENLALKFSRENTHATWHPFDSYLLEFGAI